MYLRDRKTKRHARPTLSVLGFAHHGRSAGVVRALTDFGADESFGRAAAKFEEHYGYALGRTTVLRVVETEAREIETYVATRLESTKSLYDEPIATRPGVDCMIAEMDGCEIRTGTLKRAKTRVRTTVRKLPKRVRVEAWRDVRLGLVRDLRAVTKTYVGGLRSYDDVTEDLFAAAVSKGLSSRTKVVGIADGGIGICEQMESKFANFQFILDRPHFKQHLYAAADAIGHKSDARERWVDRVTSRCEAGKSRTAIRELRQHKGRGKAVVLRLANYLERFRDSVHYESYRKDGYPTGSGEIESGHRVVPQKRLKLPGACWHPNTINPMMSLRILRENGWWNDYWLSRAVTHAA